MFKAYLEGLPNVDPERIAVMGWGYGAVWAVHSAIAGFDYQTAVVFSSPSSHFPHRRLLNWNGSTHRSWCKVRKPTRTSITRSSWNSRNVQPREMADPNSSTTAT